MTGEHGKHHKARSAIFFALAAMCVTVQLFAVTYQFNRHITPNWLSQLTPLSLLGFVANDVGDALVLLTPAVLLPARHRRWIWAAIGMVTLWCTAQLLYIPTYHDLMPFGSFVLVENVGPTLLSSVAGALSPRLLEVLLPPALLLIAYRIWFRDSLNRYNPTISTRLLAAGTGLLIFAFIRLASTYAHQIVDENPSYADQLRNDYAIMWTRQGDYLNLNGAVAYALYSAHNAVFAHKRLSDSEREQISRYLANRPHYTDNRFAAGDRPNVVLLVVESLNAWVIDLRIDNREVTPTLNALCRDSANIVALKMKTQVRNGRSSDGIFIYNTGLLPLPVQAVANTYPDGNYPTLLRALDGYSSFYACCDEPSLWNVENMAANYGFQHFYGRAQIANDIKANNYRVDYTLLQHATRHIQEQTQPYLALIHTAGMHSPYNTALSDTSWIQRSNAYTPDVRCYLERAHLFDRALAHFLTRIDRGTLLIIASDHTEYVDHSPIGRRSLDPEGDNGVLIIRGTPYGRTIDLPFGQIDLYPTLLDLLGANRYEWKGLGHSLLRFPVTTPSTTSTDSTDIVNQLLITGGYFKK